MTEIISAVIAFCVAMVAAWAMGRKSGKDAQVKQEYDMMRDAKNIEAEHDQKSIDDIRANSTKWVRRDR